MMSCMRGQELKKGKKKCTGWLRKEKNSPGTLEMFGV